MHEGDSLTVWLEPAQNALGKGEKLWEYTSKDIKIGRGDVGPFLRQFLTRTDGFFGDLLGLTLSHKLTGSQVAE